jgi:ATPase family AAA domain-containing protein 2
VPHPRLLLIGNAHQPHTLHIAPAVLLQMEHVTVHSLDVSDLHSTPGATPEEVCIQVFREAARQLPAVIYVPNLDKWFRLVPDSVKQIFMQKLRMISPHKAILLFATANEALDSEDMPEEVSSRGIFL